MEPKYQEKEIVVITKGPRAGSCGVLRCFAGGTWGVDLCGVIIDNKTKYVGYHESDFVHFKPFGSVLMSCT